MHMVKTKELRFNIPSCLLILSLWPIIKGCKIGFYGLGSVCLSCSVPYYGNGCQLECDCLQKDCNHVYGCEKVSAEKASVSPQTLESRSVAVTGTPDEERSKAEDNFSTTVNAHTICKIKKRTATKSPFLFAIIGVAALAFLITVTYTYITVCNNQRKGPNKMQLIV